MQEIPLSIFKGQHGDAKVDYRDSLPVNMYHVSMPVKGSAGYLRSQWGLSKLGESNGIDQGGIWSTVFKEHFRVAGGELIKVSSAGDVTVLGQIDYTGQCTLNQTERNIAITTNAGCWLYNDSDGLRKIGDVDLGAVFDTVYINQRLIHTDGEYIIVSDPGEDEVYNALKYGTAEIDPDGIVGLASISNRLLAIGERTVEWFADQPQDGDTFPYVRIESQLIESGCSGTHAKVMMNDSKGFKTLYMLGGGKNDPVAVRSIGAGNAPKVSTKEIDTILQQYTGDQLAGAIMENRTTEANNFVIVHLPSHTLALDVTASSQVGELAWTIQESATGGATRWVNGVFDPRLPAFVYGDKTNGFIGKLEKEINTQYGEVVSEQFQTPILPLAGRTVASLKLELLPGRNEPGTTPVLFLSSTTNGLIYSDEYLVSRGEQGMYEHNIEVRVNDYMRRPVSYRFRSESAQPLNASSLTAEVL